MDKVRATSRDTILFADQISPADKEEFKAEEFEAQFNFSSDAADALCRTVCADVWPAIAAEQKKKPLYSFAMDLVMVTLNNNKTNPNITVEDTARFIEINDLTDYPVNSTVTKSLNETELMTIVNRTLINFAFEYALTQGDP